MKITGGKLKNRKLLSPKGTATRPTLEKLRQTVFNIMQHQVEGAKILDLFSGSGAIGIEALSRGAFQATFIEKDPLAFRTLQENVKTLALLSSSILIKGDVFTYLKQLNKQKVSFDLIYADPPYFQKKKGKNDQKEIILFIDSSSLLAPGGLFFVEERYEKDSPLLSLPLKQLQLCKERKIGSTLLLQFELKPINI